jgi:hypothetical protein
MLFVVIFVYTKLRLAIPSWKNSYYGQNPSQMLDRSDFVCFNGPSSFAGSAC